VVSSRLEDIPRALKIRIGGCKNIVGLNSREAFSTLKKLAKAILTSKDY
jgi:hypothetical protein